MLRVMNCLFIHLLQPLRTITAGDDLPLRHESDMAVSWDQGIEATMLRLHQLHQLHRPLMIQGAKVQLVQPVIRLSFVLLMTPGLNSICLLSMPQCSLSASPLFLLLLSSLFLSIPNPLFLIPGAQTEKHRIIWECTLIDAERAHCPLYAGPSAWPFWCPIYLIQLHATMMPSPANDNTLRLNTVHLLL